MIQLHIGQLGSLPHDRVAQLAAGDAAARFQGDVRSDLAALDSDTVLDIHGIVNRDSRKFAFPRSAVAEQYLIRLEQSIELPAIVPASNLGGQYSLPMLDHPLKGISQVPLSLVGGVG